MYFLVEPPTFRFWKGIKYFCKIKQIFNYFKHILKGFYTRKNHINVKVHTLFGFQWWVKIGDIHGGVAIEVFSTHVWILLIECCFLDVTLTYFYKTDQKRYIFMSFLPPNKKNIHELNAGWKIVMRTSI